MVNLTYIEWALFGYTTIVFLFVCFQHIRTKELYRLVKGIHTHLEAPVEVSKELINVWKRKLASLPDNDPDRALYIEALKKVDIDHGD